MKDRTAVSTFPAVFGSFTQDHRSDSPLWQLLLPSPLPSIIGSDNIPSRHGRSLYSCAITYHSVTDIQMTIKAVAKHGEWNSPISQELVTASSRTLGEPRVSVRGAPLFTHCFNDYRTD